jgi:hypothetical protein
MSALQALCHLYWTPSPGLWFRFAVVFRLFRMW